jgi:hypothetical protein
MTSRNEPILDKRPPRYWETSDFWKDAGERIVTSYMVALALLVTVADFDLSSGKAWIGALVGAGISTVKALVGAFRSKSTTPVSII